MTAKKDVSALTSHMGFWMRLVSNNVSYTFADKLASAEVTVAEWVILREMYGVTGATSGSRVAELTGLTRGAVSKLISRLLEKGLVTRTEALDDRRYQEIELTDKGTMLVPHLALIADQNEDEFFSVLSESERRSLMKLLKKIVVSHKFNTMPIN